MDKITCDSVADVKRSLLAAEHTIGHSRSQPALRLNSLGAGYASDLAQPGGFRRAFVGHTGAHAQFHMPILRDLSRSSSIYGGVVGKQAHPDGYLGAADDLGAPPGMSVYVTTVTFLK